MSEGETEEAANPAWRVLLIDPRADARAEIRRLLNEGSQRRYQIIEADTAVIGLRVAHEAAPDCALLDHGIPDMNAGQLLAALVTSGGLTICPVLVMGNGSVSSADRRTMIQSGAQDFLSKTGLSGEDLVRAVENAVERHRLVCDLRDRSLHEPGRDERDAAGRPIRLSGLVQDVIARKHAEQSQARSERFSGSVVQASVDCVEGLSPDGRLLWMNPNGQQLLEICDFDSFKGRDWRSLWDVGGSRSEADAALVAARSGRVGRFRGYCPTATGRPRWWDVAVTAVLGSDGQVEQLLCVSRDVTDFRDTEDALGESEGRLQIATEAAELGLHDYDPVAGKILWDARVRELWGVGADTPITYEMFIAGVHPEDRAATAAAVALALDPSGRGEYHAEYRVIHLTSGRIRWVVATGRAFFRGGRAVRLVGTVQDVSARKAAERRLTLEHEVSQLLLHAVAFDEVVPAVLRAVLDGVDADFCALWLPDESGEFLRCTSTLARGDEAGLRAFAGASGRLDAGIDLPGRVWKSGRADWVEVLEADPTLARSSAARACGLTSGAAAPLGGNPCLGAVEWFSRAPRSRDEEVMATVTAIGAELGQFLLRKQAEAARQASEERLRLALEATAVGAWEWNIATNQIRWDLQMFRIYGIAPTPGGIVEYADWSEAVLPEDLEEQEEDLAETIRQRGSGRRTFRVRRRDNGECRYIESVEMVRLNNQGQAQWVVGTNHDVTTERLAADALAESERRFRVMADGLPFIVWVHDPSGRLQFVNQTYCDYFGVTVEQVLTCGWEPLIHPDDRRAYIETFLESVRNRLPWTHQCRVRGAHGSEWRWVESSSRPRFSPNGEYLGVVGCSPDVTDRKRAEAALEAHQRQLGMLSDNTPDILARFDRQLRHVFVNAAVESATGRSRGEFLGKTNREIGMATDLCDRWDGALQAVFASGRPQALDFDFSLDTGVRHYTARLVPECGPDGEIEYVLAVTHDATERIEMEQALRDAGRRKDEFLATLAHELRNPLAPLQNGLEIIKMAGAGAEPVARSLQSMDRQLKHMVRLIDDLMDVSRITQGKVHLRRERVALSTVIDAAIDASMPLIARHGHELAVMPIPSIWLDGDPTRLTQIFANLLTNAAKYTEREGQIELSARLEADVVAVSIRDTGIGIPRDMLTRVFEMFNQVDRTLEKTTGGLGIGLSLARGLVALHGGSIAAASAGEGRGSEFTVRLPILVTDIGGVESRAEADATPSTSRRVSILVVDDNRDAAESMTTVLEMFGHVVHAVFDGEAGEREARALRPEVVLLDIAMPKLSGYDVCRRIRAEEWGRGMVLVALTGWGAEEDRKRTQEAGFDYHLTKPVELEVLQDLLGSVTKRAKEAQV